MPWHLSKSDPRKFYNERHEVVAVTHTPEQAALIVAAVNSYRAAEPKPLPPKPTTVTEAPITDAFDEYPCCGRHLSKALRTGIPGGTWTCPTCGCVWKSEINPPIRRWFPDPLIEVLSMR